jgi:2-amino-4-hydroxy-6-hydroxymethyldihydropteridine diphosphokinase
MHSVAYIGLGSNLNHPLKNIEFAIGALAQIAESSLISVSSLYQTAPVGFLAQPDFINAAAKLETGLLPQELLAQLQAIEQCAGRTRNGKKNQPRTLDLDLLLFDQQELCTPDLVIPHPRMQDRAFVLVPLFEIAPDLVIPPGIALKDWLERLPQSSSKVFNVKSSKP